ncbi:MAG: hypothetical protein JNK43_03820, partial [Ignavibacteria bacterium]|nr:hypothetical protein [Ignavibacteria bacterium]
LHGDTKTRVLNLCNALILTVKGDFEGSLNLLKDMNPEEIKEKTSVKSLMAINYYELGYYENLLSLIDAAKKFIVENKYMTASRKEYTSAFFNILKKITMLRLNGNDEFTANELASQVLRIPYITHRKWLMEKANELDRK